MRRMNMNKMRQDAWTDDEDIKLAEIVLNYIRNGRTQLEAFKYAGDILSRTAAACGFRWNATLRKQYEEAIKLAKEKQKETVTPLPNTTTETLHQTSFESVISLLEKMKDNAVLQETESQIKKRQILTELKHENEQLKNEINRYREAWGEMRKLWEWIDSQQ